MTFVALATAGDATQIEICPRIRTVGLLFTTSTGKKIEPTGATPKVVNAAIKTVRRCHAKNGFGKSFLSESEPSTQTATGSTRCGIPRLIRWEKWASSAL